MGWQKPADSRKDSNAYSLD